MSPENEAKLLELGPRVYFNLPYGFECDDGWFELLRKLTIDLEALPAPPIAKQVKEKFGGLRFYAYDPYGRKFGGGVHQRIADAETESATTCEVCGAPGKHQAFGGWMFTKCNVHAAEYRDLLKAKAVT